MELADVFVDVDVVLTMMRGSGGGDGDVGGFKARV